MAMDIVIKRASNSDKEEIVDNIKQMAMESEGKELDRKTVAKAIDRFLADPSKGFYLVVRHQGHLVGQCMITTEFSDWRDGEYWWVQSIYVAKDQRRKGVLKSLLEEIRKMAAEKGDVFGIRLYVDRDNVGAIEAYRRLGLPLSHYVMMDVPM